MFVDTLFSANKTVIFLSIVAMSMFVGYLFQNWLVTNEVIYQSLSEKFTVERIDWMIESQKRLEWVSYIIVPIVYLVKFFFVASVLWIGAFFVGNELRFSQVFGIVVVSEIGFLFVPIIKLTYFSLFQVNYTLEDLQSFYPFSCLQLFDLSALDKMWIYPLQQLNIFELIYWALLSLGLTYLTGKRWTQSLAVVAASYGSALLLWILFILFLTVNNRTT